jgi:hypothetical protein
VSLPRAAAAAVAAADDSRRRRCLCCRRIDGPLELVEQGAAPLVLLAPGSESSLQPLVVDCGSLVVISRRGIPEA